MNWSDDETMFDRSDAAIGPSEKAKDDAKLDPALLEYIQGVLDRCERAGRFLRNPLY